MEDSGAQVRVSGDVRGQVVVGDHNIVVSAERSVVTILRAGQRPACRRRDEVELLPRRMYKTVGREEELAAITEEMTAGGPVQVHGSSGMGKSTLLRMAAHALSGRWDGVVFVDAASRDIGDVFQDVFETCYDAPGYRPSPTELRRLTAGVRVCLLLDDLTCDSHLLNTVLDTVRDGRVLYSATERSLWGEGKALALSGLRPDATLALLTLQLGRPLHPDEQPVADALLQATEGSPRELLRAVTETRLRAPAELENLLANVLAGLAGTDREVVKLLGLAGAGGVSTGLLAELIPDAAAMGEVCERLIATGLVVPTVRGYRISTEVADALPERLRPDRAALAGLCNRLRAWVDTADRSPAEVSADGALLSAAIEAATGSGAAAEAARLARTAAPTVACSLRLGVWGRILEQGRAAAERAREDGILAYLTHEDGIRHLVTGKRVAATAAFAAAAEIWRRLGESDHAGAAEDAGELCGPDAASPSQPGTHDGADSADPSASTDPPEVSSAGQDGASSVGQDAGTSAGPSPDAAPDPTSGLASTPPLDASTAAVGAKGIGLTAKLVIGGSLAAVTATGLVLGQQATTPDTVSTRVIVTTSVAEVTMPGKPEDDCLVKAGGTDCTTVVTSKRGTKGPVQVKPTGPLPGGVKILYWGCEEDPEATSCTVRADKSSIVCISTTSPADKAARQHCAKATDSPRPIVRPEAMPFAYERDGALRVVRDDDTVAEIKLGAEEWVHDTEWTPDAGKLLVVTQTRLLSVDTRSGDTATAACSQCNSVAVARGRVYTPLRPPEERTDPLDSGRRELTVHMLADLAPAGTLRPDGVGEQGAQGISEIAGAGDRLVVFHHIGTSPGAPHWAESEVLVVDPETGATRTVPGGTVDEVGDVAYTPRSWLGHPVVAFVDNESPLFGGKASVVWFDPARGGQHVVSDAAMRARAGVEADADTWFESLWWDPDRTVRVSAEIELSDSSVMPPATPWRYDGTTWLRVPYRASDSTPTAKVAEVRNLGGGSTLGLFGPNGKLNLVRGGADQLLADGVKALWTPPA
ncbi:hypothetical protein AB0I10_39095 [Streptomyces sp. NPDC050636]|uniref:hypothetical protein n=1 Tax=Streptomyces sp. NPDC050636 TaxID=3154510 RepID=UPI0034269E46